MAIQPAAPALSRDARSAALAEGYFSLATTPVRRLRRFLRNRLSDPPNTVTTLWLPCISRPIVTVYHLPDLSGKSTRYWSVCGGGSTPTYAHATRNRLNCSTTCRSLVCISRTVRCLTAAHRKTGASKPTIRCKSSGSTTRFSATSHASTGRISSHQIPSGEHRASGLAGLTSQSGACRFSSSTIDPCRPATHTYVHLCVLVGARDRHTDK